MPKWTRSTCRSGPGPHSERHYARAPPTDRRGLLFGAAQSDKRTVALGISERTAITLHGNSSAVVGARSVVSVDGRQGWFSTGSNGAIAAINTYVSTFAAGDRLR